MLTHIYIKINPVIETLRKKVFARSIEIKQL